MTVANYVDPLAFLYETHGPAPFPGYAPENQFVHGVPVVVARYAGKPGVGYSSVVTETRYPAKSFKAVIYDARSRLLEFSTGSGSGVATLVHDICAAFAEGQAQLNPTDKHIHSIGMGIGHERVTLCFSDAKLAQKVTGEICSEMLGVKRLR